jgi:hypothetical protein
MSDLKAEWDLLTAVLSCECFQPSLVSQVSSQTVITAIELKVPPDIPPSLVVKLKSSSLQVSALPPLMMSFQSTENYPDAAPKIFVTSPWLDAARCARIEQALLANFVSGFPFAYDAFMWVKENAFSILGGENGCLFLDTPGLECATTFQT